MRLVLITALAVLAMAASVLYASHVQRTASDLHAREDRLSLTFLNQAERAESALAGYALTGDRAALAKRTALLARLDRSLAAAHRAARDDRTERAAVQTEGDLLGQLAALATRDLQAPRSRGALMRHAPARRALMDRLNTTNAALLDRQAEVAASEDRRSETLPALLIVALSILFGGVALATIRRSDRRAENRHSGQKRFGEAMQVADSQAEAHTLLKTHLERSIAGSVVTVLNRNNSADRLEATTGVEDSSSLSEALQQARPRSCLAVRLSRAYSSGPGSDEVLSCEVCGKLGAPTACQPLLVGGEVIGAVLTENAGPLDAEKREQIAQSVAQSAPVLANLRNLAIAETRAATDALTGLPNRRAVDDTLLRMLAQAGRSFTPMAAIILDLDHFKEINDTLGHDRGDEVLAAFGTRLREVTRASDFAGRSGGEEFVLFLPDTDRTGAVRLAEKLRTAMVGLTAPGLGRDVTASFGIACFPDDAVDASTLMRCADRALYAAKRGGRDRIEASSTGAPPTEAERSPATDC